MKKVRHRMTSLFLVCPPITCIIGLMVKCAWIGTSDINNPPLPSYGWVIVILSLSLIIWFCFSKKDLSSKELMSSLPDVPTRRRLVRPRTNFRSNQDQHCSSIFLSRAKFTITDDLWRFMVFEFFNAVKKKHFFDVENVFMMWERDSASAKIDDCNW